MPVPVLIARMVASPITFLSGSVIRPVSDADVDCPESIPGRRISNSRMATGLYIRSIISRQAPFGNSRHHVDLCIRPALGLPSGATPTGLYTALSANLYQAFQRNPGSQNPTDLYGTRSRFRCIVRVSQLVASIGQRSQFDWTNPSAQKLIFSRAVDTR